VTPSHFMVQRGIDLLSVPPAHHSIATGEYRGPLYGSRQLPAHRFVRQSAGLPGDKR
jgi:hypothetical protein